MNGNRPSLMRAIRGPITLITLGLLFTLDHFNGIPFSRTWPVLLIVFGLFSLFSRGGDSYGAAGGPGGVQ